jgi:hypothetical protein
MRSWHKIRNARKGALFKRAVRATFLLIRQSVHFVKIRSVVKFCLGINGRMDSHDEADRDISATFLCKHIIKYIHTK